MHPAALEGEDAAVGVPARDAVPHFGLTEVGESTVAQDGGVPVERVLRLAHGDHLVGQGDGFVDEA